MVQKKYTSCLLSSVVHTNLCLPETLLPSPTYFLSSFQLGVKSISFCLLILANCSFLIISFLMKNKTKQNKTTPVDKFLGKKCYYTNLPVEFQQHFKKKLVI